MKNIAVDLRPLETPTGQRGIGYYNRHLVENLLKISHPDFKFSLFTFPNSKLPKQFKTESQDKFESVPALFWPKRGLRRLDPLFSLFWSKTLNKIKPDLVHILSLFELYYLSVPENYKSVVTLYDIIPILFPKLYFKNQKAEDWYIKRLNQAKRAGKIITISNSSKRDIEKVLKIPSEKIEVVYGGVDSRFKVIDNSRILKIAQKYKINSPYILTVSTHSFHKNTSRIFQAFKEYLNKSKNNFNLVVVCKLIPQEEKDWRRELKELGIENQVILTNFVPDEDLPSIYSGAELFLFPSLYEGLGLPVLESFACGTPVITSKVSSLPEVGGDAVLYTNPHSVLDITASINLLLTNKQLKNQLITKGFIQVKKFSWQDAAKKVLAIYQNLLNSEHLSK